MNNRAVFMKTAAIGVLLLSLALVVYAVDAVVAKVNGIAITAGDLEAAVDRLIPRSAYHGSVSEEKRDEFREKALENLIDAELQYQDAVARGMKPDKGRVSEGMERIRDRFDSKREYKKALERAGITEKRLRGRVEREALIAMVIERVTIEPSRKTDDELKRYYESNLDKFRQPETVKLGLISMESEAKAKEALALVKGGEDFGAVAARMSEDSYRVKGGDIGHIHRGRVLKEIEDVAFSLKSGEMSDLIKAGNTWFIIRVGDRAPERLLSFDDAKDKLKRELEAKGAAELLATWLKDLRQKAKIEISARDIPGQGPHDGRTPSEN